MTSLSYSEALDRLLVFNETHVKVAISRQVDERSYTVAILKGYLQRVHNGDDFVALIVAQELNTSQWTGQVRLPEEDLLAIDLGDDESIAFVYGHGSVVIERDEEDV